MELDTPRQPAVAEMLQAVIQGGITQDSVGALDKLCGLYERMEAKNAEKEFAAAFVRLQQELPTINGTRGVPDKAGNVKFVYANFDDIDLIVRPICLKNGFTYSFSEKSIGEGRVTMTMRLQHSGGHFRDIDYSVRIGSGPPGATESQGDISGHTYAKRGAIESGLSLRIIGDRENARNEGGPITPAQAEELERRVKETNSDVTAFLKFAGAKSFKEIPASRYDDLDSTLSKKERGR